MSLHRRVLRFVGPGRVSVDTEPLSSPEKDEVLVQTVLSAVSPGTEKLVYRGEAPADLVADSDIEALSDGLTFPLRYGYTTVGTVVDAGSAVSPEWIGRRVFGFQPHVSHFTASPDALIPLPDEVAWADGISIPNVETAVNLLMDGAPILGERAVVYGQGVVGLLTTALLSRHPIEDLYTVEPDAERREQSTSFGADRSFAPTSSGALSDALDLSGVEPREVDGHHYEGADLVFELSGQPDVLNHALDVVGFDGRIVLGSWYGTRRAPIDLGGRYHRSRVSIISSQVSTVAPRYRGRWNKNRRMQTVLDLLPELDLSALVADPVPVDEAPEVYERLDRGEGPLQPVFHYD